MNRSKLEQFIVENYNGVADHPWAKYPNYKVFRHGDNKKWFALFMDVPRNKLGLKGMEKLDIVNLKCDPFLIGSFRGEEGIFPAYHMNKEHWLSVSLDGSTSEDVIKMLLDISFQLTETKVWKKK